MSVGLSSPLTSANTNAGFMDKNTDTFTVGKVDVQNAADATSTTATAAIHTDGGLAVEKKAFVNQAYVASLSGSKALVSGSDKEIVESTVTDAELEFLAGTTSGIQAQIDSKAFDNQVVHTTGAESVAGVKTFSDDTNFQADVVIDGDLTVNGTTTTVNSATLDVTDTNITVNNGGNDASSEGAGLTVERTGTNGSLVYQNSLASKFKLGALGSESEVLTAGTVQTVTGAKTMASVNVSGEFDLTETIDSSSTGAGAIVNTTTPSIRLTNASLASINNFDDAASGKLVVITNDTGSAVDLINDAGGTAIKRILTGTGADLTLADEASVIISYNSNKSRWVVVGGSGSGGGSALGFGEVPAGTVNGVNATFGPLTYLPSDDESLIVFVDGVQRPKSQYTVTGTMTKSIVFGGGFIPETDQDIYVWYITSGAVVAPPPPTGTWVVEYRALTSGEAASKSLVLTSTPASPTGTLVDIVGGGAQEYSVDFSVSSSTLSWSGLGLDGIITTGDKLRIVYIN